LPQAGGDVVVAGITTNKLEIFGYLVSKESVKPLKSFKFSNAFKNDLQLRKRDNGDTVLFSSKAGASRGIEWEPNVTSAMEWTQNKQELGIPNEDGYLRFNDYNGDGKPDILRWNPDTSHYTVYVNNGAGGYSLLSTFGPWGKPGAKQLIVADLDGNGKGDLALFNHEEGYMDTALSFESSNVQLHHQ